jgi:uracil-DNA glycosylase family 4
MTNPASPVGLRLIDCRLCPRLVEWREVVAREKRASFKDEVYWGRPVPAFGDPQGRLVVVGLAPAAHGANRTGRMFTGDRSGEWLYRALFRSGFANQPFSTDRNDGLVLRDCLITALVRCAPPGNRPSLDELNNCSKWLLGDLARPGIEVVVALGGLAVNRVLRMASRLGWDIHTPRPRFAHGLEVDLGGRRTLLGSYHPSQQNTFTGKLTEEMLDQVFQRARSLLS